jgi:hypothetical protein
MRQGGLRGGGLYCASTGRGCLAGWAGGNLSIRPCGFCAGIFFQGLFEAIHGLVEIIRI